jgi:hypothetical protein
VLVWFALGGFRDIAAMLRRLRVMQRDETDDGMVERQAAGDAAAGTAVSATPSTEPAGGKS